MGRGDLIRVPVAELDVTFLGVEVIVTSRWGALRTVAGGVSDVARYEPGGPIDARPGPRLAAVFPVTALFVGGQRMWLRDDDVVLTAPSVTALASLEAL